MKGYRIPDAAGLEPVPTVADLAKRDMAEPVGQGGKTSAWRISPAGQALIYSAMARNAARMRECKT